MQQIADWLKTLGMAEYAERFAEDRINIALFLRRFRRDESGSVMVLVAISIVALLAVTALAIDIANLVYAQRRLQATTDIAALAGAAVIYSQTSATTTAKLYSADAAVGGLNVQSGLTVTIPIGYPKLRYLQSTGLSVWSSGSGPNAGYNAIEVHQQATVPLIFKNWFGVGSVTLRATSLASAKGGAPPPLNIMLVIDNTASMNDTDPGGVTCGGIANATRIQCALAGVQTLLNELWPNQDQVGMMVFPGLYNGASGCTSGACTPAGASANGSTSTANDVSCASSVKSTCDYTGRTCGDVEIVSYSALPNYQLAAPTAGYCSTSTGSCSGASQSLSTSSSVVSASCQSGMTVGSTFCGTCAGEQVQGGEGTYYAGAINAAQAQLVATNKTGVCETQNCQNVILLLSDGGAGNASTLATLNTNQATAPGGTTLNFASRSIPADVIPGTSVSDTTSSNAISAGTSVVSTTTSTVTLSAAVNPAATGNPSANTDKGGATLTFTSLSGTVSETMAVSDSNSLIPPGTRVTNVSTSEGPRTTTTVMISNAVTGTVATSDTINFGGVGNGDTITFGTNNQCHEAITAAQNAAKAGTWVYSIAYGSSTANSPNSNSCSDTETPPISSCATMAAIASDPSKFYSDPMGGSCTSPYNPNYTSISSIFANIWLNLQYTTRLFPIGTQ